MISMTNEVGQGDPLPASRWNGGTVPLFQEVGQRDLTPVSQISVIVPVYNVEKYLRQCLDSLAGQTMKEIEIILIDDGSTDHCGSICDEYAEKDPRFKVFHTKNRGLSAARNLGIEKAQSEWLMFVDSDDWVDRRFCELPYQAAMIYDADMIMFRSKKATERGRIKHRKQRPLTVGLITQETAIDYSGVAVWNKLYKKKLFSNIRYPEGHVFEDTATTYKLILNASRIVMLPDTLIYYRYRKDCISNSRTNISEHDFFSFSIQKYKDLISLGYPEEKEKDYKHLHWHIAFIRNHQMMLCSNMRRKSYQIYRRFHKMRPGRIKLCFKYGEQIKTCFIPFAGFSGRK